MTLAFPFFLADPKMNWPLVLTCFLLPQSCILGASRAGKPLYQNLSVDE